MLSSLLSFPILEPVQTQGYNTVWNSGHVFWYLPATLKNVLSSVQIYKIQSANITPVPLPAASQKIYKCCQNDSL